jgi:hypothetical protein
MGRSGSTMLFQALGKSAVTLSSNVISNPHKKILHRAWQLDQTSLHQGYIYKTHDYPASCLDQSGVKCIYTYSDPLAVIPSVVKKTEEEGGSWLKAHAEHLRAPHIDSVEELYRRDALQLEHHFDSWTRTSHCDVLAIRLDALWKYQETLSDFTGFPIQLPEQHQRSSSLSDLPNHVQSQIQDTYSSLRKKVQDNEIIHPEKAI